jgi:hypothetical protein
MVLTLDFVCPQSSLAISSQCVWPQNSGGGDEARQVTLHLLGIQNLISNVGFPPA